MTTATHRALLDVKNITFSELLAKDPALADQVAALVRQADAARLKSSLTDLPEDLRAAVATVDLTATPVGVLDHLAAELRKLHVDEKHIKKILKHAKSTKVGQPIPPTKPVGTLPGVASQVASAQVEEVATLAGLTGTTAAAVTAAAPSTSAINDAVLTKLVTSKTLTDAQAKAVGFSAALYALTDEASALAMAIQGATFAQLGGKAAKSIADLARLGPADWMSFLTSSNVALPAGATAQSTGVALAQRFAAIEPNVAVFARLPQPTAAELTASLATPQTTQTQLQQLSNAYPGLGLAAIFDDTTTVTATKVSTVTRLIGLVRQVGTQIGSTQVLMLDLSAGSADLPKLGLAQLGATADEQAKVLETLKAYQRVQAVTKDIDVMHAVVGAGFTSAISIAKLPLGTFTSSYGLDVAQATLAWGAARSTMADVSLSGAAVVDMTSREYSGLRLVNLGPSAQQYLMNLPGYADLFGVTSFCDCAECESILGPAAYFVDLMKFIEDNLLNQFTTTTNPLDLKLRRPDLWTLVLSCDNTNNRVPTLDIVNQVLENYIARSAQPGLDITNRSAIWQLVYQNTLAEVGRQGAPVIHSFTQPFYLPLARIRAYLAALGSSLSAIAGVFSPSVETVVASQQFASTEPAQAELGLSADELTIVTTPSTQLSQLSQTYDISFTQVGTTIVRTGAAAGTPGVDAAVLGPAMGLSRADLGTTVATSFVSAGGAHVTIVGAESSPTSVQDDIEFVESLTIDALDRMHRFTRMVRKTGWAISDLDMVLTALRDTTLGVTGVENVAQLHAMQAQFGLSIGDLCSLVGAIPGVTPQTPAGTSFFDSLFNQSPYAAGNSLLPVLPAGAQVYTLPSGDQSTSVPAGTQSTAAGLSMTARLLTGLGVNLADLEALVAQLSTAPGNPLAVTNGGFLMSSANLTLLYRHARLSRLLGIGINQLFQLLDLLGIPFIGTPTAAAAPGKMPLSLANLLSVFDFWSWQRQSGYGLDDIAMATGGTPLDRAAYADPVTVANQVVAAAAKALTFTDTVFSVALGTPEQGSLDLLAGLAAGPGPLVVQSPNDGSWSLVPGVLDFSNISPTSILTMPIPATATVPVPAAGNTPATTRLASASAILQALQPYATPGTTFTDTVLASALSLTSTAGADDLLASLATATPPLVQKVGASWSLAQGINLSAPGLVAIGIPPTATVSTPATPTTPPSTVLVTGADVLGALQPYLPSQVLTWSLGTALSFTTDKLVALATLAGQSLTAKAVVLVVSGAPKVSGSPTPDALTTLISTLIPLAVAFTPAAWNSLPPPAAGAPAQTPSPLNPIDFVRLNPEVFGAGPLPLANAQGTPPAVGFPPSPCVSLDQLRALSAYATFSQPLVSPPAGSAATLSGLQTLLPTYNAAATPPGFPPANDAATAQLLGVPTSVVTAFDGQIPLSATPVVALAQVNSAAQLAVTLGIDGTTLANIGTSLVTPVSADYDNLSTAADTLSLALGARYTDATIQATKLDAAEQPVRAAKRDALADYLINTFRAQGNVQIWTTLDELYEYFLIDVAAGGCMTTSWVVCATMSAQLYVYRAMMHLEQNAIPSGTAGHFELTLPDDAAAQWEWRKNYRVWQANREVFLWPENYMDPDLRDDMTPLFQDLQNQLLQTDIDDQSVADAYTTYLAGFEEVASLNIAGAYHDIVGPAQVLAALTADAENTPFAGGLAAVFASLAAAETSDVLHLFGTTATRSGDAPVYYYRTCQNLIMSGVDPNVAAVWSPWQNINIQVTSPTVSPVVYDGRLNVFWVDVNTKPVNTVTGGTSSFSGYVHTMKLSFTTLRQDGTWTSPQQVQLPQDNVFAPGAGQILDPLDQDGSAAKLAVDGVASVDDSSGSPAPVDDYTLSGANWYGVWFSPSATLQVQFRNFVARDCSVDLFGRTVVDTTNNPTYSVIQVLSAQNAASGAGTRPLCSWMLQPAGGGLLPYEGFFLTSALANAVVDEQRLTTLALEDSFDAGTFTGQIDAATQIATIPTGTELLAIPGSEEDGLLQIGNDVLLLQGSVTDDGSYLLRRLGTTVTAKTGASVQGDLPQILFEQGLDVLLATSTQANLAEAALPITVASNINTQLSNAGELDFGGPYGVYYWEIFFHIPFLIANALNAQGQFEAAQKWYNYIFDPTSSDKTTPNALDRVWKFNKFRGLTPPTLRAILTDATTIAMYQNDPFNPWAIARGRISAFQKTIVMGYVGNLLDWADSLFTQFTMESVNEAEMLYIMASDILGPRPVDVGDCGAGSVPVTYGKIGPTIGGDSDFLIELETWTIGFRSSPVATSVAPAAVYTPATSGLLHVAERFSFASSAPVTPAVITTSARVATAQAPAAVTNETAPAATAPRTGIFRGLGWNQTRTASWGPALGNATTKTKDAAGGRSFVNVRKPGFAAGAAPFGYHTLRQVAAFCVPPNAQLLALWDRVEDRLYKIRHCMDINGNLRQLALFAPPINPMDLVAMTAAGLSLEDVLGAGNGDLPPYRFLYLIDKAKSYAATLGGFGSVLLSALEKKDGEQLNRLRLTQLLNLTQAMSSSRQMEIDAANAAYNAATQQLATANDRVAFYQSQLAGGLNANETAQITSLKAMAGINIIAAELSGLAAILDLIPDVGSPFAMKYGGSQIGAGGGHFALSTSALAEIAGNVAAVTGVQGGFDRRLEQWNFQLQLAKDDVQALTQQQTAAQIRVSIATNALAVHQKSIDQMQAFLALTDGKFTNLGLYTWLSATLQTLYRGAYQNALALANLAQQAFQFERGDYTPPVVVASSYWNPTYSGLLAGERLLLDLQALERRFIETNYRTLEIDQPFALSQLDAGALLELRETGQCTFRIPEVFFDLFYPGHFKRRIKAVRLTIPCITGPYVNVGATLELLTSSVRTTTDLTDTSQPLPVPPTRTVTIATSTAQNDAGVFELSFRDERYMPFEGLGAVSEWQLTLPKVFRQFDYETINDVVVSISYTAEQDGALRQAVEGQLSTIQSTITKALSDPNNPAQRLFSLRQDFSSAFTRLLRSPVGTPVTIELSDRNFPMFVRGRPVTLQTAVLLLRAAPGASLTGFSLTLDGTALGTAPNAFTPASPASATNPTPTYGGLPYAVVPAFTLGPPSTHTLVVSASASTNLAPTSPYPGDVSAIDPTKLHDVLLYVEYRLT